MRYQFVQINQEQQMQWMVEDAIAEDGWHKPMYHHRIIDARRFTLRQLSAMHVAAVFQNQPTELLKWICQVIDNRHQALADDRYIFRWKSPHQLEYLRTQAHEHGLPFIPIIEGSHAPYQFDDFLEVALKQQEDQKIIQYLRALCGAAAQLYH